jgi:hypothetical protein
MQRQDTLDRSDRPNTATTYPKANALSYASNTDTAKPHTNPDPLQATTQ